MNRAVLLVPMLLLSGASMLLPATAIAGEWAKAEAFSNALPNLAFGRELPRSVLIDGTRHYLAFADDSPPEGRFVEYVPAGATLRRWDRMLSVYVHSSKTAEELVESRLTRAGQTFQLLHSDPEKHEYVVAHPANGKYFVEYMVIHLQGRGKPTTATVLHHRTYKVDDASVSKFRDEMLANAARWAEELRALPDITPPVTRGYGPMIFTSKGRESGRVWVGP